jgi:hypothetical protein
MSPRRPRSPERARSRRSSTNGPRCIHRADA